MYSFFVVVAVGCERALFKVAFTLLGLSWVKLD